MRWMVRRRGCCGRCAQGNRASSNRFALATINTASKKPRFPAAFAFPEPGFPPGPRGPSGILRGSVLVAALAGFALGLCLASRFFAGGLVHDLHRQLGLAAIVEAHQLHFTLSPSFTTSFTFATLRGASCEMWTSRLGAEEVHEGAEIPSPSHRAFVDLADFRLGGDALDPVQRGLDFSHPTRRP